MSTQTLLLKQRQSEPEESPVRAELVEEEKTSAKKITEYLHKKAVSIKTLQESIRKKSEKLREERSPTDNLATTNCVLCHRQLILPIGKPVCKSEVDYDLAGEKA